MTTNASPGESQNQPQRNEQGQFVPQQEQQEQQPLAPPPVQTFQAPPQEHQPSQAEQFYRDFADPARANEALLREAQRQGIVPPGMSPDDLRTAAQQYAEYMHQQRMGQFQGAPPAMPGAQPYQGGYQQPYQQQFAPPSAQYGPPQQFAPQDDFVDPDQFRQALVQDVVGVLDQRQQMQEQQRQQAEQAQRVANLQAAIGSVQQREGLSDEQAQALLDNVAVSIDREMTTGRNIDFSVEGLTAATESTLNNLRSWGAPPPPPPSPQQQVAIARHRGVAPQTQVPSGAAQAGPASAPRGLQGAAARILSGGQ